MADDDPIQELHAQGKGRWIVETLTSRQNTTGLEAIELITKWRAQVHEGANPICACCDFRWTNLEMALPAAFFLARPAVPDPSGALLCGVCADCVVQKDMRREVERSQHTIAGRSYLARSAITNEDAAVVDDRCATEGYQ
jgi:hypothetical protein